MKLYVIRKEGKTQFFINEIDAKKEFVTPIKHNDKETVILTMTEERISPIGEIDFDKGFTLDHSGFSNFSKD